MMGRPRISHQYWKHVSSVYIRMTYHTIWGSWKCTHILNIVPPSRLCRERASCYGSRYRPTDHRRSRFFRFGGKPFLCRLQSFNNVVRRHFFLCQIIAQVWQDSPDMHTSKLESKWRIGGWNESGEMTRSRIYKIRYRRIQLLQHKITNVGPTAAYLIELLFERHSDAHIRLTNSNVRHYTLLYGPYGHWIFYVVCITKSIECEKWFSGNTL